MLGKLAEVMEDAPIGFTWLNEQNEFEKINKYFVHELGYEDESEIKYKGPERRTFVEMIDEKREYEDMLAASAKGVRTGPHWWTIRRRNGKKLRIRTHGEGVAVRRPKENEAVHRFGVVIDTKEP